MIRRGMTLVEVMVAMAIAMVVMGTLVVTVSRLMTSNAAARQHLQDVTTLGRLGEQLRSDAHAATAAQVADADPPRQLSFEMAGERTVNYAIVEAGIERMVHRGDQVTQRELYVLSAIKPLSWRHSGAANQVELALGRLARPRSADETIAGQFSIIAALPSPAQTADAATDPRPATEED